MISHLFIGWNVLIKILLKKNKSFTQNQTMSKIRHRFWPIEHRLVSKIIIAYR